MSDIEFLSIKEFDGKLRENEGSRTTTGDLATLTANSGKDMYLGTAKVACKPTAQISSITVELKVNGVIVETYTNNLAAGASGGRLNISPYEFKNIGQKVLATQIIKLEVTAVTAQTVEGFIEVFEETTGESPQV